MIAAPEKRVDAMAMRTLGLLGFHVTRLQQARQSRQTEGVPDLYVSHPKWGRAWLELKSPRGTLSPKQQAWHEAERAAGGLVLVVDGLDSMVAALVTMGVPLDEARRAA